MTEIRCFQALVRVQKTRSTRFIRVPDRNVTFPTLSWKPGILVFSDRVALRTNLKSGTPKTVESVKSSRKEAEKWPKVA